MIKQLGLDLGSSNTRIVTRENGVVLRAPTAAAINKKTGKTLALGSEAKRMFGKTPTDIEAYRPVRAGVIAEPEAAVRMLKRYFAKLEAVSTFHRPDVIVSVPCNINEVERRALEDTVYDAGARQVYIIESPIAAALGAGLRIAGPKGRMIVNIGGGCSEAAVLSMGGAVVSDSIRVGGSDLDRAIVQHIRKKHEILTGELTAESIKVNIGTALPGTERGKFSVAGRDLRGGLTGSVTLNSEDVREAITPRLEQITAMIRTTLEETPPELASDIYDNGILLTGGGTLLHGFSDYLSRALGIKAVIAKNPEECVCRGIGFCIGNEAAERYIKYRA